MNPVLFQSSTLIIDQKISNYLKVKGYQVYNEKADIVGRVLRHRNLLQNLLKFTEFGSIIPFKLEIQNLDGSTLAYITRGLTLFMSKIKITNSSNQLIGCINQRPAFFKYIFNILDCNNNLVAKIQGNWLAKNFVVKDNNGLIICVIQKKWKGLLKEAFTSANKYMITFDTSIKNDNNKLLILSGIITIDMVLKKLK